MSGNGRYPYAGMTGDPAKIIASANGCTDLPQPVELVDRAEDMEGQAARRGRLDWPGRRSPPDKSCLPACSGRCLHSLFHRGIRPAPARSLRHVCARAWARGRRIQSAAPFWRIRPSPSTRTSPAMIARDRSRGRGLARVAAVLDRIASDAEDLARARRAGELPAAAVLPGRRAERRRLAGPDLDFGTFCRTGRMPAPAGADGTSLGCVAGRAVPPRGDRAAARLHRQPIPRALTTPARNSEAEHHCSGNWTP